MRIRADFTQAVCVKPAHHHWVPSPLPGVERMMLDRIGGEVARATSLVRYAPGSGYDHHAHAGGEEILVLSGIFSEGSLHHPEGAYLRNPPGSSHSPHSDEGALIFVKLGQMPRSDTAHVRRDTRSPSAWTAQGSLQVCELHAHGAERVSLVRVPPGELLSSAMWPDMVHGTECLVVQGLVVPGQRGQVDPWLQPLSWCRFPVGHAPLLTAGPDGALLYLKTGHLPAAYPEFA
jgi:anti-sigma factor ChrR (cupin superfamily)